MPDNALKVLEQKKNVILVPGPLHLFWATGFYYMMELSREFNVILIVDEAYSKDEMFNKAVGLADLSRVVFIPAIGNVFRRQYYYKHEFKKIVNEFRPDIVFQHNSVYIENIYLFHLSKAANKDCIQISYQTGRECLDWEGDFKIRQSFALSALRKIHGIPVPLWFSKVYLNYRAFVDMRLSYYVAPFLLTGRVFTPVLDIYSGKFKYIGDDLKKRNRYDFHLAYYQCEIDTVTELCGYGDDIIRIKHPAETVDEKYGKALFGASEEKIISVFPSYGFTSQLDIEHGIKPEKIIEDIANKWIAALKILSNKLPDYSLIWKLHPAADKDYLMQGITKRLKEELKNFTVLDAAESAQKWIVKSRIVVTDVSTIFWGANLLKDKLVISLDIFDFALGDEAKFYEGVLYFKSLEALEVFDFNGTKTTREKGMDILSLSEFSKDVLEGRLESVKLTNKK